MLLIVVLTCNTKVYADDELSINAKAALIVETNTGKIIYEINPVWTNPVVLEPTSKGEVKMKRSDKYTIDPFDFKLKKQEEYTLTNEDTKERIKLTIY